jgi:hypothetical protein
MDFDEDAVFDADLSSGQGLLTETDDLKRRRSEPATSELRRDENEQVPERPTGELIAGARIGESEQAPNAVAILGLGQTVFEISDDDLKKLKSS